MLGKRKLEWVKGGREIGSEKMDRVDSGGC